MSDASDSATAATAKAMALWPTYALRSWLTALLTQTVQAETQIKQRIEDLEAEARRLREQLERATPVIDQLHQSIGKVDDALRRLRDADLVKAPAPDAAPARPAPAAEATERPAATETDENMQEEPRQEAGSSPAPARGVRSRRRK